MSSLLSWPALRSATQAPLTLEVERGIWGKVHGAPSDFRWIARSAGFDRQYDLSGQLELGSEDRPWRFPFWRVHGGRYYAGSGYPSRARDATGRSGFLEKQILEWSPQAGVPAALAALLLLPRVAELDDQEWWERAGEGNWERRDYALTLPPEPARSWNIEAAEVTFEKGRQGLRDDWDEEALATLYAHLCSGRSAWLTGAARPLPPGALAALLLPLPPETAGRVSLAGWVPSGRYDRDGLTGRWDVLVLGEAVAAGQDRAVDKEARLLARSLLEGRPGDLPRPAEAAIFALPPLPEEDLNQPEAGRAAEPVPSMEELFPGFELAEGALRPVVRKAPAPVRRAGGPPPLRPRRTFDLQPVPREGAPAVVRVLYEFARSDRRWLDPDELRRRCRRETGYPELIQPVQGADVEALQRWVRAVADHPPADAAGSAEEEALDRHWRVKTDLLRAAALVLAPQLETWREVGLPQAEEVPALLFGPLLDPRRRDDLDGLGPGLKEAVAHSLRCPSYLGQKVRAWIAEWEKSVPQDLRRRIRAAWNDGPGPLADPGR